MLCIYCSSLRNDYLQNLYNDELMHFIARYKFIVSIENSVCDDYITEKLWRPLIAGVVPIYFGSPSIQVKVIFLLSFIKIR